MLDNLSARLQKILSDLRGEGRLTDKHIEKTMREIRLALLEADVHHKVVKDFVERVKQKALGQEVMQSLSPAQQVVKIVRDEMIDLLGGRGEELHLKRVPSVLLLVGLQGSGKTTTAGKLALWLKKQQHNPLLLPVDVRRPAAIEQLAIIGKEIGLPVYTEPAPTSAVALARGGMEHARTSGYDVVIVDTAGRLHIDQALMDELVAIKDATAPAETLLVADAMTGQDAVKSAGAFHEKVGLTGVILTKLDGDARGGAALSVRAVTGCPIKLIGTGEKYDALDKFHPERLVGRILGMGDVLSLIEKAEAAIAEEEARRMAEKFRRASFTLEDFRNQLRQLRRMGPLKDLLGLLPEIGPFKGLSNIDLDEKALLHVEAIINSMTPQERERPEMIGASRRQRIARGSGRPPQEVNKLLKQFGQMRKMMKKLGPGLFGGGGRGLDPGL